MMETTTTTPGPKRFCIHDSFQAEASVNRHTQTTDGIQEFTYVASFKIRCGLCGKRMKFPMNDGMLTEEASIRIVD